MRCAVCGTELVDGVCPAPVCQGESDNPVADRDANGNIVGSYTPAGWDEEEVEVEPTCEICGGLLSADMRARKRRTCWECWLSDGGDDNE